MMSLFDHFELEKFLLFVWHPQSIFADTGTLETKAKVQYLSTLVCGKSLCQLDLLSDDAKDTETLLDVNYILEGLE